MPPTSPRFPRARGQPHTAPASGIQGPHTLTHVSLPQLLSNGQLAPGNVLKKLKCPLKARGPGTKVGQPWEGGWPSRLGDPELGVCPGPGCPSPVWTPPIPALPRAPCLTSASGSVPSTSDLQGAAHEGALSERLVHRLPARLQAPERAV